MNAPALVTPHQTDMPLVPRHRAFIGMGGNLGDVTGHLQAALQALNSLPATKLEAASSVYRTKPVEATGGDYLNAVAVLQSALGPVELLHALLKLERVQGRERSYLNAPRTLDLDLLWYGDACRDTADLTLPHPRMLARAFVLVPLTEVLAQLAPPGAPGLSCTLPAQASVAELAARQGVEKLGPFQR